MRGVSVARRPHGRGTMRFPDRSRGIYVGDWVEGHPQGVGSRITGAQTNHACCCAHMCGAGDVAPI